MNVYLAIYDEEGGKLTLEGFLDIYSRKGCLMYIAHFEYKKKRT